MPTKLIEKFEVKKVCKHPEHLAPSQMVYEPGIYEHTCPNCGESYKFTIRPKATMNDFVEMYVENKEHKEYLNELAENRRKIFNAVYPKIDPNGKQPLITKSL